MFNKKSNKMREIVERRLYLINSQLEMIIKPDIVYNTLTAQKVLLTEILYDFDRINNRKYYC